MFRSRKVSTLGQHPSPQDCKVQNRSQDRPRRCGVVGKVLHLLYPFEAQTASGFLSGMAVGWIPKSLPGSCKLILSEESEKEELDTRTYNSRAVRIRGARLAICIWSVSRNRVPK